MTDNDAFDSVLRQRDATVLSVTLLDVPQSAFTVMHQISVIPTLILGEQRKTVLFDSELVEDVNMFIANGQGTEKTKCRINQARFTFSSQRFTA